MSAPDFAALVSDSKKPEPPHIKAKFQGELYKGSAKGHEVETFTVDIKIPLSWVQRDDLYPEYVFSNFYADKVLKNHPGYSSVRSVEMIHTDKLPPLSFEQTLRWTANYADLVVMANQIGSKRFQPSKTDKDGKPLPMESVAIRCELFTTPRELRNAIMRIMYEPEAFKREQDRLAVSSKIEHRNMAEELALLGY